MKEFLYPFFFIIEKTPSITIKNGKRGEFKPIISGGKVTSVDIINRGIEYEAAPDLEIISSGISTGVGARARAIVTNGEVTKVEYTFGYVKADDGELKIILQHSSLPYSS